MLRADLVVVDHIDRDEPLEVSGNGCTEIDPWTGETFVALKVVPAGEQRNYNTFVTPDADGHWSHTYRFDGFLSPPAALYEIAAQCNWDNEPYPGGRFVLSPGGNPQIDGQLTVSDTTVDPGQTITITGDRFLGTVTSGVFLYPSQTHLANVRPVQTMCCEPVSPSPLARRLDSIASLPRAGGHPVADQAA